MTPIATFGRQRHLRAVGVGLFSLLAAHQLFASERPPAEVALNTPSVTFTFPLSIQAGGKADVTFKGNYLDRAQRIRCECSDLTATIRSGNPLGIEATIEASASATPGPRFLYVETPKGPSNRVLVRVTGWTSVSESEPNESYEQAQPVTVPVMIEGKIATVHDSDMFRFHADAGERLAFNVLTGRSKAPGHVVAILMTTEGRVLSRNLSYFGTDPYLDYTFEDEGDYILTVIPRRFSDFYTILSDDTKINWQYELAIGRSPILWSLFPMGGKRGTTVDVELRADFLDPAAVPDFSGKGLTASLEPLADPCQCLYKLAVDIAADAPLGPRYLTFPDPSGTLMPLAFSVGDTTELTENEPNDGLHQGQPITLPVVLNGRIDRPGDRDGVFFTVDQYDEIAFLVDAKGLGSHITDPNLTLARPDGELTGRADDRCEKCGQFFNVVRKKEKLDSKFWHYFQSGNPNDADAAGDYILRLRDNSKRGGPNHTYRLLLRNKAPDFRIGVVNENVRAPLGGVAKIPVTIRAEEGFKGGVEIRAEDLPPGLTAKPLTLRTDEPSGMLEIEHDASALEPDETTGWVQVKIRVVGTAKIDDKVVSHHAELPAFYREVGAGYNEQPRSDVLVSFVEPAKFSLKIEEPFRGFRMDLSKGGRIEVPVEIARAESFMNALDLQGVEFPPGLHLEEGLEEEGTLKVTLVADTAKIEARAHRIAIRATASENGVAMTEVTRGFTLQVK